MPSISVPTAIIGAAAVGAGTSLASASMESGAAKSASQTQATAETQAADQMQQQYGQTRADLLPYNQAGQTALAGINDLGAFNFQPTEQSLEDTPGYKFNLSQGLKATQNGFAAQGLGTSGAALKGAATFASGLAGTTYQNQFSNALSSYNTNLGKLQSLSALGEGAAAQTGQFGTTTAGNIGQTAVGAANAEAAGTIGSTNAITGGITSGLGNLSNAFMLNSFLNGGAAGGAGIYSQPGFGAPGQNVPEFY